MVGSQPHFEFDLMPGFDTLPEPAIIGISLGLWYARKDRLVISALAETTRLEYVPTSLQECIPRDQTLSD